MGKPSVAKPRSGDIWDYPYLWQWQHEGLETEGRKSRPAAFVTVMPGQGGSTNLFILPINSSPPQDRIAIEVPQIERRRAGLDDIPLWVVIDEYNHDLLERSYYFDPNARIGAFSGAFHRRVLESFVKAIREKRSRRIPGR